MNRLNKTLLFSTIVLMLVATPAISQKKYDKKLQKADDKYEYGDYKKANKLLGKFRSAVEKKLGTSNKYIPIYYLREAMYSWASGIVVGFESSIDNAVRSSATFHGESSADHALIQMQAAEIYLLYENYHRADSLIKNAERTLATLETIPEDIKAEIELSSAKILSGKGYYNEAMKYISDREDYFKGRAGPRETTVDDAGKLVTRVLEEKEVMKRYSNYAAILTLKASTLGDMGEVDEAYFAYEAARDWILKERRWLGKESYEYIQNQFAFANFKVANGLDPEELGKGIHKEEDYIKILSILKRGHNEGHYMAFDIYETILRLHLTYDRHAKYRNLKVEYERAIEKNFKKGSLHYINLQTLEFNTKLTRDKTKNLEDRANAILANTQSLPRNHVKTISVLDFLYRISIKDRNFPNAEKYLNDIIAVQRGLYGDEAPNFHLAKLDLASFYLDYTNKIDEAEQIYNESFFEIVNKEIKPLHVDYISILNQIAALHVYRDRFPEARETLDQALKVSLEKFRDKEDMEYAKELEKVASLEIALGDYDQGKENIETVLDIYKKKKIKNDPNTMIHLVKASETKAKLLGIEGYFDDAEDLIKESQDMLSKATSLEGFNTFAAIDELASLYIFLGRYVESNELLDQLLAEYEKIYGSQSGKMLNAFINLGRLQMLEGKYTESEKTALTANNLAETVFGAESTKSANAKLLLGEVYTMIGDYEKAITITDEAVNILENKYGRDHVNVALALSKLGVAKFYNGDSFEETEEIIEESRLTIAAKLGLQNPRYAEVSTNLAKVFISEGKENEALAALSLSADIWKNIVGTRGSRRNVNVGKINLLAGDVYYAQRKYTKAEEFYELAQSIFKRTLPEDHPEYVKVLARLSRVYYMEGDSRKAKDVMETAIASYDKYIRDNFKALSERQQAKFWNSIKSDFEFYNTLAIRYRDEDKDAIGKVYNNALMTKAILLNSQIRTRSRILGSGDEELISKYKEWQLKKENVTKAMAMSSEMLTDNNINLTQLNHEVEEIEKYLASRSDDFGNEVEKANVEWQDVRKSLQPNQVALEMVRFRYFDHVFTDSVIYAVIYVKNEKQQPKPDVVLINNGYDLENKYFKFHRNSIIYKVRDPYSYEMYWEPIVSKIGNLSTIFLSPDGVYNQMNLESIPLDDGKYVLDNSNIILVSNTKDIYLRDQQKLTGESSTTSALMFGNPKYYYEASASNDFPQLPGTEREVNTLRNLLSDKGVESDYYTGTEATEDQIKSMRNPQILHIATHGFFTPEEQLPMDMELNEAESAKNPLLRTGLIMGGGGDVLDKTSFNYNLESGILTAQEAMNLNLDQTDLVVLSACETGLGEIKNGEGVYGLQRAFLVAGAETLIMSMFKVDDTATQKLMVNFYEKWMNTGNKRQSFVEAKKELRNEYQDPIYWGSFIMMGLDK